MLDAMTDRVATLLLAFAFVLIPLRLPALGEPVEAALEAGSEADENGPEAVAAARARGTAAAQKDIQSGILRLRDYGEPLPPDMKRIDSATGYKIERVHNCDPAPTKAFLAELSAYNDVMHAWHDKHK
jgi:hypothetical protein